MASMVNDDSPLTGHILVILRDGRHLMGYLRSYDQFGNIVLHDAIERIYTPLESKYAQVSRGLFLIRGENMALLGESVPFSDRFIL
jgi:U6 snRNA-associated Sm-like protein LSm1